MTVGIVGLGLIGGSFAKAYHEAGATVLAWNRSRSVLDFAIMSGAVDAELTEDNIAACDLVLIALYPEATIEWFRRMAPHIGAHPVVLDCGGTKRTICAACFPIAKEHGVTFLGGHPMAGTQYSGFKNAKATMYHGAPMVIVPPDFDDVLLFDHVKQLLINLIDNAIKYSNENSEVKVTMKRSGGNLFRIDVLDHGIGIAKEHQERVFERFYRVDKARSRKLGGTGLGLAIVKHVALLHGGKPGVVSEPGKGSDFYIQLPLENRKAE